MRPVLAFALIAVALTGCNKKKEEAPTAATAPAAAPAAAPTPAPAPTAAAAADRALLGKGQMQHCPTSVEGAKVAIEDAADGVVVTVTGASDDAAAEIRKRAQHLATAAEKDPSELRHTGGGEGGGASGKCAVVLKDTKLSVEEIPGGAKVTVRPTRTDDLEWLRKETRNRQAAL